MCVWCPLPSGVENTACHACARGECHKLTKSKETLGNHKKKRGIGRTRFEYFESKICILPLNSTDQKGAPFARSLWDIKFENGKRSTRLQNQPFRGSQITFFFALHSNEESNSKCRVRALEI